MPHRSRIDAAFKRAGGVPAGVNLVTRNAQCSLGLTVRRQEYLLFNQLGMKW